MSGGSVTDIVGHDFAIDGSPVAYGDISALTGRITGTLSSGELLGFGLIALARRSLRRG